MFLWKRYKKIDAFDGFLNKCLKDFLSLYINLLNG